MRKHSTETSFECERCGYPAPTKERLLKHLKDGTQCRPLKSKISLEDLYNKIRPPPPSDLLTCEHCDQKCKSKSGLTNHLKHCKQKNKPQGVPNDEVNASNIPSTSSSTIQQEPTIKEKQLNHKHVYFHKNVTIHKDLHPFHKEIEWESFDIDEQFFLDCCECRAHGIIELFTCLHRHPNHDNIKWSKNKLVIYNGKGWVEATESMLTKHIGFLYSILEEKWFDYQSNIRCGNIDPKDIIDIAIQKDVDKFFYDDIVDDDSVFFYCKDALYEYMETLKE